MFLLDMDGYQLIGSSPETHVRLGLDGTCELRPIAGTRPRGATPAEDDALAAELLASEKDRAEHTMLVDLARNDLSRVCRPGSVRVEGFMDVERYSHVMHLVSRVFGHIADGQDAPALLRATFPAGTVSGAPKVRAMQIISELEGRRRGAYAGAVGWLGFGGDMDTCIAIRTVVLRDGVAYLQSGCGVVSDSDPGDEYREAMNKVAALGTAIDRAESGEYGR
jgi:anthranilate synthase component 1